MTFCEKCGKPIKGEILRWQEAGGRHWLRLCWPCKKPMMAACLPKVLAGLKQELESPVVRDAISRFLSDGVKEEQN